MNGSSKNVILSSTGKTAIPLHWNQYVGAIDSKVKLWDKKKQKCNWCLYAFVDIQTKASLGDKKGIVKSGFI